MFQMVSFEQQINANYELQLKVKHLKQINNNFAH